jgi:hypothetical protein
MAFSWHFTIPVEHPIIIAFWLWGEHPMAGMRGWGDIADG